MSDFHELYRDEYMIVSAHSEDGRVAVQVGNPPDDARPTITDGEELHNSLREYLKDHHVIDDA